MKNRAHAPKVASVVHLQPLNSALQNESVDGGPVIGNGHHGPFAASGIRTALATATKIRRVAYPHRLTHHGRCV
ncbi:hypothetical protein ACOSP7_020904 [Xanthoceras sorbifolium]